MARHDRLVIIFIFCRFFFGICEAHECQRACDGNSHPKICKYRFTIGVSARQFENATSSRGRIFLSINKKWPPPSIIVCQNDSIVVEVKNQLPYGSETSFHWYGFTENNSPFMDGVPMITQCPIYSHTSFIYRLTAFNSGTFYYRAHSVSQQLDGLFGPVIVKSKEDELYRSQTVVVSPQMETLQTFNSNYEENLNVSYLLFETYAEPNENNTGKNQLPLRLRIINAAALNCPITLYTHTVPLKVVSVDGNDLKPRLVNDVTVNPGERVDLLIRQEVIKVIYAIGHNLCDGHVKYGLNQGKSEKNKCAHNKPNTFVKDLWKELESESPKALSGSEINIFLPFDVIIVKNFNGKVDFRYKLGDSTPYAPSFLTKENVPIFQIYNKSFMYPPSPILSQPENVPKEMICNLKNPSELCSYHNNDFCECLGIINLPFNKNVNLYLIDEGKNNNISQTVHIHGHMFYILAARSYDRPIKSTEIEEEERLGKIPLNLVNPVKKDTVVVPNKGFIVLRITTKFPGKWLIESTTSKAAFNSGLEILMNVEDPNNDLQPFKNFPKCGSMKNPDLVIIPD